MRPLTKATMMPGGGTPQGVFGAQRNLVISVEQGAVNIGTNEFAFKHASIVVQAYDYVQPVKDSVG
jgi:hypothetical protein